MAQTLTKSSPHVAQTLSKSNLTWPKPSVNHNLMWHNPSLNHNLMCPKPSVNQNLAWPKPWLNHNLKWPKPSLYQNLTYTWHKPSLNQPTVNHTYNVHVCEMTQWLWSILATNLKWSKILQFLLLTTVPPPPPTKLLEGGGHWHRVKQLPWCDDISKISQQLLQVSPRFKLNFSQLSGRFNWTQSTTMKTRCTMFCF